MLVLDVAVSALKESHIVPIFKDSSDIKFEGLLKLKNLNLQAQVLQQAIAAISVLPDCN